MSALAKDYGIVDGLFGDDGENAGRIAICAILDQSVHYPDSARIIVGSPTPEGYEPNLGQFCGSADAIEKLARKLLEAVADVRAIGQ